MGPKVFVWEPLRALVYTIYLHGPLGSFNASEKQATMGNSETLIIRMPAQGSYTTEFVVGSFHVL